MDQRCGFAGDPEVVQIETDPVEAAVSGENEVTGGQIAGSARIIEEDLWSVGVFEIDDEHVPVIGGHQQGSFVGEKIRKRVTTSAGCGDPFHRPTRGCNPRDALALLGGIEDRSVGGPCAAVGEDSFGDDLGAATVDRDSFEFFVGKVGDGSIIGGEERPKAAFGAFNGVDPAGFHVSDVKLGPAIDERDIDQPAAVTRQGDGGHSEAERHGAGGSQRRVVGQIHLKRHGDAGWWRIGLPRRPLKDGECDGDDGEGDPGQNL